MTTVQWRKQPIYVVRRTPEMLQRLPANDPQLKDPKSENSDQPDYARNEFALAQPRVPGARRHLHAPRLPAQAALRARHGASSAPNWPGGFFCPCHGSQVRSRRARVRGLARLGQPARAAVRLHRTTRPSSSASMKLRRREWRDGRPQTTHARRRPLRLAQQALPDRPVHRATSSRATTRRRISTSGTTSACSRSWCWCCSSSPASSSPCTTSWARPRRSTRSSTSCARWSWGWLIRYMHSTGASFFFIVVYLHMFRALLYGSYKAPRELLWLFGMLIYLALMAEAFFGYVLPWGNMSFWGAQVIVNLFGTIPVIGEALVEWIRGDYGIADATLNRFFALHVVARAAGAAAAGGAAPRGAARSRLATIRTASRSRSVTDRSGKPLDGIPFHPYYTVKDLVGVGVFLDPVRHRRVLRADASAGCSSSRRTSSRRIRCPRPSTSRRCGTSRRTTRSCAPCRTSSRAPLLMAPRGGRCSSSCPGSIARR